MITTDTPLVPARRVLGINVPADPRYTRPEQAIAEQIRIVVGVRMLAVIVPALIAALLVLALHGPYQHLSDHPAAHPAAAMAVTPVCDTDAECAAWDAFHGDVPPVQKTPLSGGRTAVQCPPGWDVDGDDVTDTWCTPSDGLVMV